MSTTRQIYSDEEFWAWCNSRKPCKRCGRLFFGPLCPCELPLSGRPRPKKGGSR